MLFLLFKSFRHTGLKFRPELDLGSRDFTRQLAIVGARQLRVRVGLLTRIFPWEVFIPLWTIWTRVTTMKAFHLKVGIVTHRDVLKCLLLVLNTLPHTTYMQHPFTWTQLVSLRKTRPLRYTQPLIRSPSVCCHSRCDISPCFVAKRLHPLYKLIDSLLCA